MKKKDSMKAERHTSVSANLLPNKQTSAPGDYFYPCTYWFLDFISCLFDVGVFMLTLNYSFPF